jgi:hypothetical protein
MVSQHIPGDGKDFGVLNPYNITHEDAKFNFSKFTRPGEICRACEQHTLEGAGGEFGPTL